jgi:hypothetical protein
VLERAGLVVRDVRGREHLLKLDARPLERAADWIDHYRAFWNARLDALERFLRPRNTFPQENTMTDVSAGRDAHDRRARPPRRRPLSHRHARREEGLRPSWRVSRRRSAVEAVVHLDSEGTDLQPSIVTVELFDKGENATELN